MRLNTSETYSSEEEPAQKTQTSEVIEQCIMENKKIIMGTPAIPKTIMDQHYLKAVSRQITSLTKIKNPYTEAPSARQTRRSLTIKKIQDNINRYNYPSKPNHFENQWDSSAYEDINQEAYNEWQVYNDANVAANPYQFVSHQKKKRVRQRNLSQGVSLNADQFSVGIKQNSHDSSLRELVIFKPELAEDMKNKLVLSIN